MCCATMPAQELVVSEPVLGAPCAQQHAVLDAAGRLGLSCRFSEWGSLLPCRPWDSFSLLWDSFAGSSRGHPSLKYLWPG